MNNTEACKTHEPYEAQNYSTSVGKIHLSDFPPKMCFFLEGDVRYELFEAAINMVGSLNKLAPLVRKDSGILVRYRQGILSRDEIKSDLPIPQELLRKLCEIAGEDFNLNDLERHVLWYKSSRGARRVYNPKLPIIEGPELFRVISHLICDGNVSPTGSSEYCNSELTLHEQLKADIRATFGDIELQTSRMRGGWFRTIISKTISNLLFHRYGIEFSTYEARLPKPLFLAPKKYARAALEALADDEGYIGGHQIQLGVSNEMLCRDYFALLQIHFPNILKHAVFCQYKNSGTQCGMFYIIRIRSTGFLSFNDEISFRHPKKRARLIAYLSRPKSPRKSSLPGVTRNKIIALLKKGPHTRHELAKKLDLHPDSITRHLNNKNSLEIQGLIGKGIVRRKGRGKYGRYIYELVKE